MDPNQRFIVRAITRAKIADVINGVLQNEGWMDSKPFAGDDERLTDAFCQEVADFISDVIVDDDSVVDATYECIKDHLIGSLKTV